MRCRFFLAGVQQVDVLDAHRDLSGDSLQNCVFLAPQDDFWGRGLVRVRTDMQQETKQLLMGYQGKQQYGITGLQAQDFAQFGLAGIGRESQRFRVFRRAQKNF